MNDARSDVNPKNTVDAVEIPVFANDFFTFAVVALASFVLTGVATKVSLTSDCPKISLISGFLFDVVVVSSVNCFCSLRYPSKSNSGFSNIAASPLAVIGPCWFLRYPSKSNSGFSAIAGSPLAVIGAFSLSIRSFSAISLANLSLSIRSFSAFSLASFSLSIRSFSAFSLASFSLSIRSF